MDIKEKIHELSEEMIQNLGRLVAVDSQLGTPEEGKPFGEGPAKALEVGLKIADELGFQTVNLDNYCGYAEMGEGKEIIGIAGHLDIVPVGGDWTHDPFVLTREGDYVYGRGTTDDKGPVLEALYAMKLLRDSGVKLNKRVRLIMGCNEETGSKCMAHYNEVEEELSCGFTPDANFPCIHGEKGHMSMMAYSKHTKILSMNGGFVTNAVCDSCTTVIPAAAGLKEKLEKELAEYVGVKNCVSCGNGTDALVLALKAWGIGAGDAVFVPDHTFFSSAESVAFVGATPVFADVHEDTFNVDVESMERCIQAVIKEGKLKPKAMVVVDLFGLPADYDKVLALAEKYGLYVLEDCAQGFGSTYHGKKAGTFGHIATTSFFPAKPLGCYGDGGAIFTDNDEWAALLRSMRVHGKGSSKYDNVRLGMNSRLDTIQAAVLQVKLKAFKENELTDVNRVAARYTEALADCVKVPQIPEGYTSSWASYNILFKDEAQRDEVRAYLQENGIPTMIYYPKGLHQQKVFENCCLYGETLPVTTSICKRTLAIPVSPYLAEEDQDKIIRLIREKTGA